MQAAVKIQAIRLKVIYGGLALIVDIVTMQQNLNLLISDFQITGEILQCVRRLTSNTALVD